MPADDTDHASSSSRGAATAPTRQATSLTGSGAGDRDEFDEFSDLDVEAALLAMSEDIHGPTEDVDLSKLSPTEKQALLRYLRQRLGIPAA